MRHLLVAVALLAVPAIVDVSSAGAPPQVRVRTSQPFEPCLPPALAAFTRETGLWVALEVRQPEPVAGADVLVAEDSELTRALEGGSADLQTATDLGLMPWVFVSPPGAGSDMRAAAAAADQVVVPTGRFGREARAALGSPTRVRFASDPAELRAARFALVPRSLAGPGQHRPVPVQPLLGVATAVADSPNAAAARRLLAFLASTYGRHLLSDCVVPVSAGIRDTSWTSEAAVLATVYGQAVVDWWLPRCSLERNGYNDPTQVIGAPDAISLGEKDQYRGFMSLGQGGYVTIDTITPAVDGTGADVRVYQTVSSEPVTLYAASSPQGPFTLLGLQVRCGTRTGNGIYSGHCDFDLSDAGLREARYFKIEDGEIYPCLRAGTITEGPDIDAVQVLNPGR